MPYVIASPETKPVTQALLIGNQQVRVTKERTLDHVTIDDVHLHMPLNDPTGIAIGVYWSVGYMDGDELYPVAQEHAVLDKDSAGSALFSAMQGPVTPGTSHYGDFKGALYGLLATLNLIPSGAIV